MTALPRTEPHHLTHDREGAPVIPASRTDRLTLRARLGVQDLSLRALAVAGDPVARWIHGSPRTDVYALYERIRRRGPVARSRAGLFALTSAQLCEQVLRDPTFGVRPAGDAPRTDPMAPMPMPPTVSGSFLELDPPEHTRLRRVVAPAFRPRAVRSWAPRVEAVLNGLIDGLARSGRLRDGFDVMADLASPFPIAVISAVLGVPDVHAGRFREIGLTVGKALDGVRTLAQADRLHDAGVELEEMFTRILDQRADDPRDDVLSALAAARADGTVTVTDGLETAGLLLIAGFETTVNLIGNGVAALQSHPDWWERLREEPRLAPAVVEETLRWTRPSRPPVGSRTPTPSWPAPRCPPGAPCSCCSPPPTAIRPPTRTRPCSTRAAAASPTTSASPPASTTASARPSPASRARSRSACSPHGCRSCGSCPALAGGPAPRSASTRPSPPSPDRRRGQSPEDAGPAPDVGTAPRCTAAASRCQRRITSSSTSL